MNMKDLDERLVEREEDLLATKAAAGDRPSLYILGLTAAKVLEQQGIVVLATDIRGVVHVLPRGAVQLSQKALVPDRHLDEMIEEDAIQIMLREGRSEDAIIAYLKGRDSRGR